jgi:hypothetical protein
MAAKKKRPSGGRAKVKKLKVKRAKVEMTDRDATKVRGGMTSGRYSPATSKH